MTSSLDLMEESDAGGIGAKHGFLYQDYAAAFYLTKMLLDKRLKAVRCEVTDDIDLIYDNYIEYIQVKTTDSDSKWTLTEFCSVSKPKKIKGVKNVKSKDSIFHKSLMCNKELGIHTKFRILSQRDVRTALEYLKIERESRDGKKGKEELIASLSKHLDGFRSDAGNGADYWVENGWWEVIPSINELELMSCLQIMQGAAALNIYLDPTRDQQRILNDILCTLTKKSAISRKINCAADKSYSREDFLTWFHGELNILGNKNKTHAKIYSRDTAKFSPVLLKFIDLTDEINKIGAGLEQGYHRNKYRFEYIADTLKNWLPELLLRPEELADTDSVNLIQKLDLLAGRFASHSDEFEIFVGKLLLHATIRFYSKSQPIPAILYVNKGNRSFKEFENIHIVKCDHTGDELWMGFSKLARGPDIKTPVDQICKQLDILLSDDFQLQREKILDIKQDNYLFKHDINEILNASASLDHYKDRFRFVIFFGYDSAHLSINMQDSPMAEDYKEQQKEEVKRHFKYLVDKIHAYDNYFNDLNITVYLFPTPCIQTLLSTVKNKLKDTADA